MDDAKAERRTTRAERRAKQRLANVGRAKAMHQLRLSGKYPLRTSEKEAQPDPAPLQIGCSGWFYWDWKGLFYPEDLPTSRWFSHYARLFNTVELNAPFYSWPLEGTVKTWLRQAANGPFVYTVKVSELITHVKRFKGTKTLIRDFGLIADMLGPRMGCFLFQLPPSFHYTASALKAIVSQLEPRHKNVVEFRHASWWNENVYAAFRDSQTIFCSCSGPKLPEEVIRTADDIYVRFHGTQKWYRHDYAKTELAEWANQIRASGAKTSWIYFNNDHEGFAIKNAKQLHRLLLSKRAGNAAREPRIEDNKGRRTKSSAR